MHRREQHQSSSVAPTEDGTGPSSTLPAPDLRPESSSTKELTIPTFSWQADNESARLDINLDPAVYSLGSNVRRLENTLPPSPAPEKKESRPNSTGVGGLRRKPDPTAFPSPPPSITNRRLQSIFLRRRDRLVPPSSRNSAILDGDQGTSASQNSDDSETRYSLSRSLATTGSLNSGRSFLSSQPSFHTLLSLNTEVENRSSIIQDIESWHLDRSLGRNWKNYVIVNPKKKMSQQKLGERLFVLEALCVQERESKIKPFWIFGTCEFYQHDLLACWALTNRFICTEFGTWPPGYNPCFPEEELLDYELDRRDDRSYCGFTCSVAGTSERTRSTA